MPTRNTTYDKSAPVVHISNQIDGIQVALRQLDILQTTRVPSVRIYAQVQVQRLQLGNFCTGSTPFQVKARGPRTEGRIPRVHHLQEGNHIMRIMLIHVTGVHRFLQLFFHRTRRRDDEEQRTQKTPGQCYLLYLVPG